METKAVCRATPSDGGCGMNKSQGELHTAIIRIRNVMSTCEGFLKPHSLDERVALLAEMQNSLIRAKEALDRAKAHANRSGPQE
jgi:hypothetical protein